MFISGSPSRCQANCKKRKHERTRVLTDQLNKLQSDGLTLNQQLQSLEGQLTATYAKVPQQR